MLRARTLQERCNPYVCAFCRHKLSPREGQLRNGRFSTGAGSTTPLGTSGRLRYPDSKLFGIRALSTSSSLRGPDGNGNPSRPGGFPGGGFGAGVGGFGSFASTPPATKNDTSKPNALLPHEWEARQKMGLAPAKPSPKVARNANAPDGTSNNAASKKNNKRSNRSKNKDQGPEDNTSKPQSGPLSSSLLAEAFKIDRTPALVATPSSWSQSQPAKDQPSQKSSAPKQAPWGAFSARRVDTEIPVQKQATPKKQPPAAKSTGGSEVWGQLKRSRRSDTDGANESSTKGEGDFWEALENRVTGFRGKKTTAQDSRGPGSRSAVGSLEQGKLASFEASKPIAPWSEDQTSEQPRRKSRFEEEAEEFAKSGGKKDKRQKNRRRREEEDEDWDDEAMQKWEARQRRKAEKDARRRAGDQVEEQAVQIFLPEYISISNLAHALRFPVPNFLRDLENMGFEDITEDTIMTGDTAGLVAMEYGLEPTIDTGSKRDLRPRPAPEDPSTLPARPPVVTIMGHVDHGKTTLLDWLRKSSIAAGEHGGITQHIGAFVVNMSSGKQITFLDTPGHAAFLSMRQRGANVTDIVVLVVAADDSVMPQTIEALKHATSAKVPIIVAINKIDKEDARVEQVKADLARHGVEIEDYGGDVQVVCVSGKTGKGMEDLEENIVTLAEMLDVRSETDSMAEGWVLESSIKQVGKSASVLVKRGTLRLGDYIVAGKTWAKIRVLRNEAGIEIPEAPPGTPVEVLGWRDLPEAGERVLQSPDEGKAKTAIEYRQEMAEREQSSAQLVEHEQRLREKAAAEEAAAAAEAGGVEVPADVAEPGIIYQNVIVKADVAGSVEAVNNTVQEIGNHEVQTKILRSSVGAISEYDVDHAATSNSVIVNFNNAIQPHIRQRADENKVRIIDHSVIYHVADEVKDALSELLPQIVTHRVLGEADILQVFAINLKKRVSQNIAGCKIRNGAIKRTSMVKVLRRGKVIFDGKINTLKHVKKDVMEMGKGTECGIGFEGFQDVQIDDQIQTYEEVKEKRHL
ncbi:translation initiation factor IF-2 [Neonectria punicea]|uniref:Translation initiation factor IF-2, mitochondrial n=1 Tax=Neonectria punicea TaxID=979145 RepID=A0ABR1GJK5_9HYPO